MSADVNTTKLEEAKRDRLEVMIFGADAAEDLLNQIHCAVGDGFVTRPEDIFCHEQQIARDEIDPYLSKTGWTQIHLSGIVEGLSAPPKNCFLLVGQSGPFFVFRLFVPTHLLSEP